MYSESNHIYTNKGIYSVYDLYNLKLNNLLNTIKLMSYDTINHLYQFIDIGDITLTDIEYSVYEISFVDILSEGRLVIYATNDINIYQFNTLVIEDDYLQTKKVKVNQYIQNVLSQNLNDSLHFCPVAIDTLVNYSVHMPNISLGDNLIKFEKSIYKSMEKCYNIIDADGNKIPLFMGQAINAFYNFVLVK